MAKRIRWVGVAMMVLFGALFVQLNHIQVLQASTYANAPGNPRTTDAVTQDPRGIIEAANGTVLAQSVPAPPNSFGYKYERTYPRGGLYADVVGYDSPIYGMAGAEATFTKYLTAHNAPVTTLGDLFTTRTETDTVTLTIEPKLQQAAAAALGSTPGAVVALDPATGAVEAMYSYPTYDPNQLASVDVATEQKAYAAGIAGNPGGPNFPPMLNTALDDTFAPGSTFKIVTTSAAYQHTPQYVHKSYPAYTCLPPGSIQGQTTYLCNYAKEDCGGDIAQLLPPSCDTGYSLLAQDIGPQYMYDEATAFGFNQQPPIDLPHSPYDVSVFKPPSFYQHALIFLSFAAIGQKDTAASPLQMAMVASAIADHGRIMTPHVLETIRDSQGNLVQRYTPSVWKTPDSPATATAIGKLMHLVVTQPNGTAYFDHFNPADDVGVKTGTAQVGPHASLTTNWMIAIAPVSNPKIAVAVVVPDQPGQDTGAGSAGPVVKAMITAALGQ
ncbi:MAG: penicillin-binding transpeptidase domain-containing protein [Actinomycetota bacterium]|jgi:peptidoglycan glycosyltransferase|nr:penicillin-binding transpeptidase domain-containing protein [Actinomycetota bacterium]